MKINILLIIASFAMTSVFSQVNLNEYKYVIVAKKFDFLNDADQYQLNSISKFLFNKYGFEAFMEGEDYPEDLIENKCLALKANAFAKSKFLTTLINVELSDCNDKVLFVSDYGESRLKDFQKAYSQALRDAFKYVEKLNYKYTPKANKIAKEHKSKVNLNEGQSGVLYAQIITEGFQVVDSTPKVVMVLISTSKSDVFIVKDENAIVFKENEVWYYTESAAEMHVLNLKF